MAGSRSAMAVEIGGRSVRAVLAERHARGLSVRRVVQEAIASAGDGVARDDAEQVGRWLGEKLTAAGFPRGGKAVLVVPREQVVLKRLTLPTTESQELPEMTRMALSRELPFPSERAVIDFVTLGQQGAGTTVLAVAIDRAAVEWLSQAARHAGLGVERITLRSMGAAALLAGQERMAGEDQPPVERTLLVDMTGESVEFAVISGEMIRFSRAAPLHEAAAGAEAALVEAVLTETRRTWLSYRMSDDAEAVGRVVVLGPAGLAAAVGRAIAPVLSAPASTMNDHPLVDGREALAECWSLAGLLLEDALELQQIDFLKPRRAADAAGERRKKLLIAAGLALVVGGLAWTVGNRQFLSLSTRAKDLAEAVNKATPTHLRIERDKDKLTHLQQWESINADWLVHARRLHSASPPPSELVLDGWTGILTAGSGGGVAWDRKTKAWSAPLDIKIVLDGEAKDRAMADAYRDALIRDERYVTTSAGTESTGGRRLAHPFMYVIKSQQGDPNAAAPTKASAPPAAKTSPEAGS